MEVHHKHHQPKNIGEYFVEFLMLFLAVTLGFFAENLREHKVEKEREIKFLQIIHQDLETDIGEIDRLTEYNKQKKMLWDSMVTAHKEGVLTKKLADFYYYARNLSLRALFESSHNGFIQLKNAGGLRMIKNKEIIGMIQRYENQIAIAENLQELNDNSLALFRTKASRILNVITSDEMNENQDLSINSKGLTMYTRRFGRPADPKPLLVNDPVEINELMNYMAYSMNTNKYIILRLTIVKKLAHDLDSLIVKEYGQDFE